MSNVIQFRAQQPASVPTADSERALLLADIGQLEALTEAIAARMKRVGQLEREASPECPDCEGDGFDVDDPKTCRRCKGEEGNYDCERCRGEGVYYLDCKTCEG